MEASSTWTYCVRPIRFLFVTLLSFVMLAACSDPQAEAPEVPAEYLALRKSDIVYGPVNEKNPFESVGMRHNDLVHAVIGSLQPWDTLDLSHTLGRIESSGAAWGQEHCELSADRSLGLVQAAFAMKIDSSTRQRLATFSHPGLTSREQGYIRRIGRLLQDARRFADVESGLAALEREILAESWPAGDSTETAARIAISTAKHSFAYWKRMMCCVYDIDPDGNALGKTATDLIYEATTRGEIITAADVIGVVVAWENATPLGSLVQLQSAIITGGSLSLVVAAIVYWNEIKKFGEKILPWNW